MPATRASSPKKPPQKFQRRRTVHADAGVEKRDARAIADAGFIIKPPHLRILIRHPLIHADAVAVAALDEKRLRRDDLRQLRVARHGGHAHPESYPS